MAAASPLVRLLLAAISHRPLLFFATSALVTVAGWTVSLLPPNTYEASADIAIAAELLQGVTGKPPSEHDSGSVVTVIPQGDNGRARIVSQAERPAAALALTAESLAQLLRTAESRERAAATRELAITDADGSRLTDALHEARSQVAAVNAKLSAVPATARAQLAARQSVNERLAAALTKRSDSELDRQVLMRELLAIVPPQVVYVRPTPAEEPPLPPRSAQIGDGDVPPSWFPPLQAPLWSLRQPHIARPPTLQRPRQMTSPQIVGRPSGALAIPPDRPFRPEMAEPQPRQAPEPSTTPTGKQRQPSADRRRSSAAPAPPPGRTPTPAAPPTRIGPPSANPAYAELQAKLAGKQSEIGRSDRDIVALKRKLAATDKIAAQVAAVEAELAQSMAAQNALEIEAEEVRQRRLAAEAKLAAVDRGALATYAVLAQPALAARSGQHDRRPWLLLSGACGVLAGALAAAFADLRGDRRAPGAVSPKEGSPRLAVLSAIALALAIGLAAAVATRADPREVAMQAHDAGSIASVVDAVSDTVASITRTALAPVAPARGPFGAR